MSVPNSESGRARSSRNKSPADKCTYPKCSTILLHCVPLPLPGAPKTNTTFGFAEAILLKTLYQQQNRLVFDKIDKVFFDISNWLGMKVCDDNDDDCVK